MPAIECLDIQPRGSVVDILASAPDKPGDSTDISALEWVTDIHGRTFVVDILATESGADILPLLLDKSV
jgi:hypothetical protein